MTGKRENVISQIGHHNTDCVHHLVINQVVPPVQVTLRVSKLRDILLERVFASSLYLDCIPYTSIIEAMYALFGDTVTVEFIVSSLDDTPNLNELAR